MNNLNRRKRFKPRFSLSVRLTVFFSLIVVLVTATLSTVVFYQFGNKINQQINRNLTAIADHKASEINNLLLFESANLLSWRASSVMLDVVVDDLDKRIATELANLKQSYRLQGDLFVFNAAGLLIASTRQTAAKTPLPKAWQSQQDYALVFKHELPFINGSVIAHVAALKPPQLKTQGYLVLTHTWEDLSRLLSPKESLFALRKGNEPNAELFTPNGVETIPIQADFSAQSIKFFHGGNYLSSISEPMTIGDFSFQIAALTPEKIARAPLLELTKNLLLAATLVTVPIIVLVILLSRVLVAPVKKLTNTIRTIESSKDLSIKVPVSGNDEVANLGHAFNRMTAQLGELFDKNASVKKQLETLNSSLEHQVIERTAQLQDTLTDLSIAATGLQKRDEIYHSMLAVTLDGFWLANSQGKLLDANDRYVELSGYSREELLEMSIFDLDASESAAALEAQMRIVILLGKAQFETRHRRKDHSIWHVEISITYLDYDQGMFFIYLRDISKRKQSEERSLIMQENLKRAKEVAEQSLADHRQFIAMVSHELRSPLAVIDTAAQLLSLKAAQLPDIGQIAARIRRGVSRLSGFIDNSLTDDRLNSKGYFLQIAAIDLAALEIKIKDSAMLKYPSHPIVTALDPGLQTLNADPLLLDILLSNLLDNAVKYSPAGSEVRLAMRGNGQFCLFEVTDRGIGISAEEQAFIFNKYMRGSGVASIAGAGLGLSLVKDIVTLHHGSIKINSSVNAGACITVAIPLHLATHQTHTINPDDEHLV